MEPEQAQDPLTAQCQAKVGQTLQGKWTLSSLIGVGGMAAVYLGKHRNGATAAIKLLHSEYAAHGEIRERFLREAYIANKVDHPGAVRVLDDDVTENGEPYLVMELLRGLSLESYAAKQGGALPLATVLAIADHTLGTLEKAHAAGIVHRDLKPDNLFLTENRAIKILDFGIARLREGADQKRTQTGMVMGTPAYMAPEQALGRWKDVDARTDLFAVGAIMFTLITGRDVHVAETAGEQLVMAASRPAPSLARVVEAPIPIVQLVDRALAYEASKRFQNANEMRAAVQAARQSLTGAAPPSAAPGASSTAAAAVPESRVPPAQSGVAGGASSAASPQGTTATGAAPAEPGTMVRRKQQQAEKVQLFDASFSTKQNIEDLTELFSQLEKYLAAQRQYGSEHPEVSRRHDALFAHCASSLLHTEVALAWNITPYAFVAGDAVLWEPRTPWDRIPYQLFSDGIRLLGFLPGTNEKEFYELVRMITMDRTREMAPEDDFATMLWDACFEYVIDYAIDSFAQGDQKERAEFERMTAEIVKLAHFDSSFQLEDSWAESRSAKQPALSPENQRATLVAALSGDQADTEALARAEALKEPGAAAGRTTEAALAVDPATVQILATRIDADTVTTGERFVVIAARTYQTECLSGDPSVLAAPLSNAIDRLAEHKPEMAIAMVLSLCNAVWEDPRYGDPEAIRGRLAGEVVSTDTMRKILAGAIDPGANRDVFVEGLTKILNNLDNTHVPVVLEKIGDITDPDITGQLIDYLARKGRGHEEALGAMFEGASVELGLALVRVLAAIESAAARQAISMAAQSPHPVVRIEALGHVEGVSSERLRIELRGLIEDHEASVRLAALQAMEHHNIRVAGPFLVLRIKSDAFDKLPFDERKQALSTLASLAPNRAEPVCLELLQDQRMVSSEAHERTRAAAAEMLGRISSSKQVIEVLEEAATKRWRSSERVRSAAKAAMEQVGARIAKTLQPGGGG